MLIRKLERFSSLLQLLAVFIGGLWFCYRGTTFNDPTGHSVILPAAMAILAGLTVIMVVLYVATLVFLKDREQA